MEKGISDIELTIEVKDKKCSKSLNKLISRHSPLCFNIYQRYTPAMASSGVNVQDVYKERDFLIYQSAISYNPDKKTKFSTWLGNQVRYFCLNSMNNSKKRDFTVDENTLSFLIDKERLCKEREGYWQTSDKEVNEYALNLLSQIKDSRVKKIFKLRYFNGESKPTTWVKIGIIMNVSTQTAINLHEKGKKIILKKMRSEDFLDRI
jgi:RNA polymerase sigma factor (sigma-70 family)